MPKPYVVTGTLTQGRVVQLDTRVPLDDSKVKVTLEPLPSEPARPVAEAIDEIRRLQARRGFVAPTRDEVDRFIVAERESWGD